MQKNWGVHHGLPVVPMWFHVRPDLGRELGERRCNNGQESPERSVRAAGGMAVTLHNARQLADLRESRPDRPVTG